MARTLSQQDTNETSQAPTEVTLPPYRGAAQAPRGSPSPGSLSTLSVSPAGSQRTSASTARPSIFENGGMTVSTEEGEQQPEVFEESDGEGDGDNDSVASNAEEFELFASNTDETLASRFLFAKQCDADKEEENDYVHKNIIQDKLVLQEGLDADVSVREIPKSWVPPTADLEAGEPHYVQVDNPGRWPRYVYQPRFSGSKTQNNKKFLYHSQYSGARVVPETTMEDGTKKRIIKGWEFHYQNVDPIGDGTARGGATTQEMFPDSRKGSMDVEVLKRCGLSSERMINQDAMFWFQILLPFGDPTKSGVAGGDPRLPFYSDVVRFTDIYRAVNGIGGTYGNKVHPVQLPEIIRYHGALIRDGVKGESDGGIHRRWDQSSSSFDFDIAQAMTLTRFRQIKRILKLNNNYESPRRGEEGYDPAYKFTKIYDVCVHNTNAVTKTADLDLCGDESTWGFMGYGEYGSGLVSGIIGKPGVSRGGQFVIVSDAYSFRPRAIIHRHKLHHRPPGFKAEGPNEVRMVADLLEAMVRRDDGSNPRGIFTSYPHMTWDNYFSGDSIMNYLGGKGFGATMTCRRDRFPEGVTKDFFHWERGKKITEASRVARYCQPITAVKSFPADGTNKAFTRAHVSFQSTGSTNLSTVNAINSNCLFVAERRRGTGDELRRWGIEMNAARHLYLKTYGTIDTIDAMIKRCHIGYRCRKYWHSAMNHGLAMVVVVAYDMYRKAASGSLGAELKVDKVMDFHRFRDRLSGQMLTYSPTKRVYPGDSQFRVSTKQSEKRRLNSEARFAKKKGKLSATTVASGGTFALSTREYKEALESGRLCTNLAQLSKHLKSFGPNSTKGGVNCHWCGEKAYTVCGECGVALHNFPVKGKLKGAACSIHYHDPHCFGLANQDCNGARGVPSRRGIKWQMPSAAAKEANRKHIEDSIKADL